MAFRAAAPSANLSVQVVQSDGQGRATLGLLTDLPGTFIGTGFNLVARPTKPPVAEALPYFLELNGTHETLSFHLVGDDIPDRGFLQDDIELQALRYFQDISDCETNTRLHIESGFWLHVPATTNPQAPESYVRQATIPHGVALNAQTTFFDTVHSPPQFAPVDSTPFTGTIPDLNSSPETPIPRDSYLLPYTSTTPLPTRCLPPGLDTVATIKNPVLILKEAANIIGQNIIKTDILQISTIPNGGLVNIPFLAPNANAVRMDAIFWIETIQAAGKDSIQLQYVQRVILDFQGVHWPHISVATLVKQPAAPLLS
jgi:hypothetical protein